MEFFIVVKQNYGIFHNIFNFFEKIKIPLLGRILGVVMLKEKDLYKFMVALLNKCKNIDTFSSVEVKKDLSDLNLNKKINPKDLLGYAKAYGLIKYTYFGDKASIDILDKGIIFPYHFKDRMSENRQRTITLFTAIFGAVLGVLNLLLLLPI